MRTRIVTPAETDPRRHIGHLFDWQLTAADTGGALSIATVHGWKGGEPPLHVHHREDEFFVVLDGEITFMVGDEVKRAGPGSVVWGPRDVPHSFRFETDTVRVLIGFLPAGQEKVFHAFSEPDPDRRAPAEPSAAEMPDLAALEAADRDAGVDYLGPPLAEILAQRG